MSERDDFVHWFETRLRDAEVALHNGDAGPRHEIWSTREPVTVFGAWRTVSGQQQVRELFDALAERFSDCTSYKQEIVSAEVIGDAAYTVSHEHTQTSVDGEPRSYSLRATQIYRRDDGEWKVAHRHADAMPEGDLSSAV